MGYALPGGGRRGGVVWLVAAACAALAAVRLASLPPLPRPLAVTAPAHLSPARAVRVAYRDADGRWRQSQAWATGRWATASAAQWRRDMPGMRVLATAQGVDLAEQPGSGGDPYYVGIERGRVAIWAGRPGGFHLRLDTTPLLAGALDAADLARLRATIRVRTVSAGWQVLSRLGT
jgi:hypothetical protein